MSNVKFDPEKVALREVRGLETPYLSALVESGAFELLRRKEELPEGLKLLLLGDGIYRPRDGELPELSVLAGGRIEIGHDAQILSVDGKRREISKKPFAALSLLALNADRKISREEILDYAWPNGNMHSVNAGMKKMRTAIGGELGDIKNGVIKTVRGYGYVALNELYIPPNGNGRAS